MKLKVETQYCFIIKLIALDYFLSSQNERKPILFPILCVIHKEKILQMCSCQAITHVFK